MTSVSIQLMTYLKPLPERRKKPDSETTGDGLPQNPAAKRKPDGSPETSRSSPSASASVSQGQTAMDLDTIRLCRNVYSRHLR